MLQVLKKHYDNRITAFFEEDIYLLPSGLPRTRKISHEGSVTLALAVLPTDLIKEGGCCHHYTSCQGARDSEGRADWDP